MQSRTTIDKSDYKRPLSSHVKQSTNGCEEGGWWNRFSERFAHSKPKIGHLPQGRAGAPGAAPGAAPGLPATRGPKRGGGLRSLRASRERLRTT